MGNYGYEITSGNNVGLEKGMLDNNLLEWKSRKHQSDMSWWSLRLSANFFTVIRLTPMIRPIALLLTKQISYSAISQADRVAFWRCTE